MLERDIVKNEKNEKNERNKKNEKKWKTKKPAPTHNIITQTHTTKTLNRTYFVIYFLSCIAYELNCLYSSTQRETAASLPIHQTQSWWSPHFFVLHHPRINRDATTAHAKRICMTDPKDQKNYDRTQPTESMPDKDENIPIRKTPAPQHNDALTEDAKVAHATEINGLTSEPPPPDPARRNPNSTKKNYRT